MLSTKLASIFFACGLFVSAFSYLYLRSPVFSQETCLLIEPGQSFSQFLRTLNDHGSVTPLEGLKFYAHLTGTTQKIRTGEYCFAAHQSIYSVLHDVVQGHVMNRTLTLPPGITYAQLLALLEHAPSLLHSTLLPAVGYEGTFLPETYSYRYPDSDADVLSRANRAMITALALAWEQRDPALPYKDPYQALIVASIIEKESAHTEDRRLIAGVIINRLNSHMRLQMDSTVIYGLAQAGKNTILDKPALRYDTPYNTYVHEGLPPTPICMPDIDSIQAALHPVASDYFYFVAKGEGRHQFSVSLHDHQRAINQYIKGPL